MNDLELIMQTIRHDKDLSIRVLENDLYDVYVWSNPNVDTVRMDRVRMTLPQLADFIRSGEFARTRMRIWRNQE